jgi:hypothetical protein
MKQLGKIILLALGFGIFAAVLGQFNVGTTPAAAQNAGPPSGLNVNVVNTPLPVTGSVNATVNFPSSIGISGNSATSPLFVTDVDNPAKQPFTSSCFTELTAGDNACIFKSVPAGKELVIEMFSASIEMVTGRRPVNALLEGTANGVLYGLFYPLSLNGTTPAPTPPADFWAVAQPLTRAYADQTTATSCHIFVFGGDGINATCGISGYLVKLP